MNNTCVLTLRFPSWSQLEVEEFLETIRDSNDVEIKSHKKLTTKGTNGISTHSSVISILTSSVTISNIIYDWFQNRKKNNKLVKYMQANNVMIPGNCERGYINQKIQGTLPYWKVNR